MPKDTTGSILELIDRYLKKQLNRYKSLKMRLLKVKKRSSYIVDFDQDKITKAIFKAAYSVGGNDLRLAQKLSEKVVKELNRKFDEDNVPSVEDIQDTVENVLIMEKHAKTAKAYILYRQKRTEMRQKKKGLLNGLDDDSELNLNQVRIAAAKYLKRDEKGQITETPLQMFRRVANCVASPEKEYYGEDQVKRLEDEFYTCLKNLEFIPGGRTLANAGTAVNQLANCFVIPVEDSMEEIFEAVKHQALVQKTGGGTGFDFSRLRPTGDYVVKSNGIASGPVSFIKVFDAATSVIMQGNRRGANMGILRVDHPDVIEFITTKDDLSQLTNFNISVAITDEFMNAVKEGRDYQLVHPKTKKTLKNVDARMVFDMIVTHAWKTGEPGVIFIDRINQYNKIKHIGVIEATNPCGEVPLLPYEVCNLGSINLSLMVKDSQIHWDKLRYVTRLGIRMLDNVIDAGTYPLPQIDKMAKKTRRIGLGVLGFADMLYQLQIPYNSEEGVKIGEQIMEFIQNESHKMSQELAEAKGVFPAYTGSEYDGKVKIRNCALTSIAPTGTLSMLADTSGGIEPNFALCFIKNVLGGEQFIYVNKYFEKIAKERGFYSQELMKKIAEQGSLDNIDEVPEDVKKVFVIAHNISPEWHIKMQAGFQKNVDNSISKTINFSNNATIEEVKHGYFLAFELGCKGCTVYRDGSRANQVLNIKEVKKEVIQQKKMDNPIKIDDTQKQPYVELENQAGASTTTQTISKMVTVCPECNIKLSKEEGCVICHNCGFSACTL